MAMRIHQPIPEAVGRVVTPDGTVEVLPYQIVVMVSIAAKRVIALPADDARFPAVLDTGNNHNFAIRHEQLDRWTGLSFPKRGLVTVGGRTIPLYAANVWIHTDLGEPFRMRMEEGIVVYPPDLANPARLPILGLWGLVRNGLMLIIDEKNKGSHDRHCLMLRRSTFDAMELFPCRPADSRAYRICPQIPSSKPAYSVHLAEIYASN